MTFRKLLEARSPQEAVGYRLDGHVEVESMLFEAAVPAVPVILAALTEELAPFVRSHFLVTLLFAVSGESHSSETAAGRDSLEEECYEKSRDGLWVLYREAVSGDTENALDVLEIIEEDETRFSHFRTALASRLAKKQKTRSG
ncbi:hypothetical protein PV396_14665 [Streptomyces sp. ME02-8801-2C]|uniref:hypothetical protein n=1 Tax=Streptomyces sp. ME02-8801-2C TaxID=3028680 RepID=UPI0029B9389C|nr:hypothetical protein [Streptomyces sp. ME02-8801-2C]MDX3453179.1 hypothetical protein [Streptomyces sp. ME02-8801-2C]